MAHLASYDRRCAEAGESDRRRILPQGSAPRDLVDFISNDYLDLAHDPQVRHALRRGADRWGVGATGSRLLSGTHAIHTLLERRIACDLGTETALIFPSGYQLNVAVLAALLDRGVLGGEPSLFTDRLIHASLHQAARLAGVREHRFRHNDLAHLEQLLQRSPEHGPRIIVSETLFGMEGDCCDLDALRRLAHRYQALLFVDEAHAVGLLGRRGYGMIDEARATELRHHDPLLILMGTFSKALGGAGGYVACSERIRAYLIQCCSGFIATTALAPPMVAAAWAAWRRVPELTATRARLFATAADLRARLQRLGLSTGVSTTPILPLLFGDEATTLRAEAHLRRHGFGVRAIRPPTVPSGTSRLRIALRPQHTSEDIAGLIEGCATLTRERS